MKPELNKDKAEKPELNINFIPMLCSAPFIYAHNTGIFEKNGLTVNLKASPGWSGIKALITYDLVDAVHMLSPMPFACNLGLDGKKTDLKLIAFQNIHGQAITLSNKHRDITDVKDMKGFKFGVPYKYSMHYYLLCHFLEQHGLDPFTDITIDEVAPPRMPYYIEKGWLDGILGPEPYNQMLVYRNLGFIFKLSKDILPGHPCCSFVTTSDFIRKFPVTYQLMLKSIVEAQYKLHKANADERMVIARNLCSPDYLNITESLPVEQALSGIFPDGIGNNHNIPDRIDFTPCIPDEYVSWILSQMQARYQINYDIDYNAVSNSVSDKESYKIAKAIGFDRPILDELKLKSDIKHKHCSCNHAGNNLIDYELSKQTGKRIEEIIKKLALTSSGNLDIRLNVTSNDEIGQLEKAINETLLNLKFSSEAILEQKEKLEENKRVLIYQNELLQAQEEELTSHNEVLQAKEEELTAQNEEMQAQQEELLAQNEELLEAYSLLEESKERLAVAFKDLEEAGKHKDRFLSSLSHELRTPLNSIIGFSDLLQNPAFGSLNEKQLKYIRQVSKSSQHLLDLIMDLLDITKIDSGKIELHLVESSPIDLITEVLNSMELSFKSKNLTVITSFEYLVNKACLDRKRFKQIISNLLSNSIKYTPENGQIFVSLSIFEDDKFKISVKDTGIGIPGNQVHRIFEEFYQADKPKEYCIDGLGIGLNLTRKLVIIHGGSIFVNSIPGEGSTFTVLLPLKSNITGTSCCITLDQNLLDLPKYKKILVVEDNDDNLALILDLLGLYNHKVIIAKNGKEAIDIAVDQKPQLIFMDIRMPVMDGLEATKRLRSMAGFEKVPIISLTASVAEDSINEQLEAGCSDCISKPFNSSQLFNILKKYL